jgi:hypothetical protein
MKLGFLRTFAAAGALAASVVLPASAALDSIVHQYSFSQTQADGSYFSGTFFGADFDQDGFLNADETRDFTYAAFDGPRGYGDGNFRVAAGWMTFNLAEFKANPDSNSLLYFNVWTDCWHCNGYYRSIESKNSQTSFAYTSEDLLKGGASPQSASYFSRQINGHVVIRDLNLAAVPEPGTYAMLLAGLGLLGFAARKRRA